MIPQQTRYYFQNNPHTKSSQSNLQRKYKIHPHLLKGNPFIVLTKKLRVYLVNDLRSFNKLIILIFISIFVIGVEFASANVIIGQSAGYVQYGVTITGFDDHLLFSDFLVTESVSPTGQPDFIDITLSLSSATTNFTYSRVVNSSSLPMIFPYLPGLTNQSISYDMQGISLSASLANTGQTPVTFNDINYQATNYLVSLSATNSSKVISAEGKIVSMPSGLIYKIQLSFNQQSSVELILLSTDLDLNQTQNTINPLAASILGGGAIVAIAIAVPTIFKKLKRNKSNNQTKTNQSKTKQKSDKQPNQEDEKKPSYWVD